MTGEQLIQEVEKITKTNLDFIQKKIKHLSFDQLNWRPNSSSWSIREVMAHLNSFSAFYHPVFERKIERTRFRTPTDNFVSSPLGRATWKSMKLGNAQNIKRKFRATFKYNPSMNSSLLKENDLESFIHNQDKLLQILENAKKINIRKAKVPVSISKIIKFRMGDALLLLAYHSERHIEQIRTVLKHPQFPNKQSA